MRNRLLEILAAIVGVAIVGVLYVSRTGSDEGDAPPRPQPLVVPSGQSLSAEPPPSVPRSESMQAPAAGPEAVPESEAVADARQVWENARAELAAVEAGLEVLDQRFDAKEAELAEREAAGMDPDALEEEMLIFLDGIVDEYDELETRLAEAEALELEAAERLNRLEGRDVEP